MAFGSGSSLATDCWTRRGGLPSSLQAFKVGRASRLHQHSSSKPTVHSGSEAEISISRSLAKLAFFSFVEGVGGGDPPLGPHPANPEYSRKRGSDGLPAHVLLGQPLLEGDIGGHREGP